MKIRCPGFSVRLRASLALLSWCGLLSPFSAGANDLQSGDLLLGASNGPFGSGAILLARNGSLSVFCQSPPGTSASGFFAVPRSVIADSLGRVVFLAEVGTGLPVYAPGTALLRCDFIGATPEMLAYFPSTAAQAPGYPMPSVPGVLSAGQNFESDVSYSPTATALHLLKLHTVSLNDLFAGVNTQDAYSLVVVPQGSGTSLPLRYRASDQVWDIDSEVMNPSPGDINITDVDVINHSGATYSTNGDNIEKFQDAITVEASGTILGTSFSATLNLFGSANTFPIPNYFNFVFEDNAENVQWVPSGCNPPAPPASNSMPENPGGALIPFGGGQTISYDEFSGYGLMITTNYGPAGGPWVTNISESLLDNPGDPTQYFQDGNIGCLVVPFVPVVVPLPFNGPPPAAVSNSASSKPAGSVIGPVAVQASSTLPGASYVIGLNSGTQVSGTQVGVVVSGSQIAATNFPFVQSVGAYPNGVSAGSTATILLRVDSPVNVLITDPNGKQLGVDALGNAHNDFSGTIKNPITNVAQNVNNGFDSGPGEPRFLGIKNPVSGTYNVQSVGTGSGPYTVHVYSVNLSNPVGQAISSSGTAAVGSTGSESFTLDAAGDIAFLAPTCASNVNAAVGVLRSGYSYSPILKRYGQTVELTNTSGSAITGPISLVLEGLSGNASLLNASGKTTCTAPVGSPYVAIAGPLAAGASTTVVLQFSDPTNAAISYTSSVLAGAGPQ